jgi:ABC-type uncharacterized transport system substrate-binding protein
MSRRGFIIFLLATGAPLPVFAQGRKTALPVIGFLRTTLPGDSAKLLIAFRQGLKEAGYVEGQNVAIEFRWAQNQQDQLPALAADLVRRRVAVIMASGNASALAAKAATTSIPIVFSTGDDPVQLGLVASLSRPAGNVTGASFLVGGALGGKRLELLHELTPSAGTLAYLTNPGNPAGELDLKEVQAAARALRRQLLVLNIRGEGDVDAVFANLAQQRAGALLVSNDALFFSVRKQLVAAAARHAIPAIYHSREFTESGGLMSYGTSLNDSHRQAGVYVGRILQGAKPADLPVLLPTKYELVVNLSTAKKLGLNITRDFLARVDEVIQ